MKFRRALAVTVLSQGLTLVVSMAFTLLAARWLGVTDRGLQSLLVSAAQVSALVLGGGFPTAIPSLVGGDARRAASAMRTMAAIIATATVLLVIASVVNRFARIFPQILEVELAFAFAVLVVATLAQPGYATIALTLGKTWSFNLSTLIAAFVGLAILSVGHVLHRLDVGLAVMAQGVGLLLGLAYVLWTLRRLLRLDRSAAPASPAPVPVPEHRSRISAYSFFSAFFALLAFRGDIFLVTLLGGGLRAAGVYSLAVFTAEMILKIPNWSALLLAPRVAAQPQEAAAQTVRLVWFSVALSALLLGVSALVGTPIRAGIQLLVGKDYVAAYTLLAYFSPRIIMQSAGTIFAGNLAGKGYTAYTPLACFLGMLGVWGFDVLLIPRYGLLGASLASSLGYVPALAAVYIGFLKYNDMSTSTFVAQTVSLVRIRIGGAASKPASP